MTPFASTLIYLMALGTVFLDVAIVIILFVFLFWRSMWRVKLEPTTARYALVMIFILSTLAVLGTLYMQYGAGLNPCLFCWYQRVFMYPIPIISLIAILKGQKISDVADHILGLSVIGFAIALYQHLLQVLPSGALIPCDATDDCAIRSVFEFHFVTIPWMAVTLFFAIGLIALIARRSQR